MTLADPNYHKNLERQREIERLQVQSSEPTPSEFDVAEMSKAAAENARKLSEPQEHSRLTPEQQATEKKIRASAWKDYLNEKRWCAWFKGDPKPDGDGFAKVPVGKHNDPNTWCSFEELCAKLKPGQGFGYNFLGGDLHPWDLDHVRNPRTKLICNEAMTFLSRFGSFAEVSISGKGLHVITKGSVRGKQLTTTILQYWNPENSPRFFTVTGDVVGEAFSTIRDIGEDFNVVFAHSRAHQREVSRRISNR